MVGIPFYCMFIPSDICHRISWRYGISRGCYIREKEKASFKNRRKSSHVGVLSPSKIRSQVCKSSGKLHCFVGPMFSGKTTAMIAKVVQCADVTGECVLVINHIMDKGRVVGNGDTTLGISSHCSQFGNMSAKLRTVYTDKLNDVDVSEYNLLALDETSFFEDLYDTICEWLSQGKHIYCAGLSGDFMNNNLGQVHRLLPIADNFIKLSAVCQLCTEECKGCTPDMFIPAPFTAKISGDMTTTKADQGGKDKYRAVCRYHYNHINDINHMNDKCDILPVPNPVHKTE